MEEPSRSSGATATELRWWDGRGVDVEGHTAAAAVAFVREKVQFTSPPRCLGRGLRDTPSAPPRTRHEPPPLTPLQAPQLYCTVECTVQPARMGPASLE